MSKSEHRGNQVELGGIRRNQVNSGGIRWNNSGIKNAQRSLTKVGCIAIGNMQIRTALTLAHL